jgi:hypothetical protein
MNGKLCRLLRRSNVLAAGWILTCVTGIGPMANAQQTQGPPDSNLQQAAATNLPRGKKLVMKDGNALVVRSYEVKRDKVRYYSVERSEWEEVPAAMIDWDATKKVQDAEEAQQEQLVKKIKKEEMDAKAMAIDADASLEVAPHVFLPPGEGIFLLDGKSIFPLSQSEASNKLSKGRVVEQVLSPIPIVPSRHTVSLNGARASFRITNATPEFYLRTTDPVEPEVELIAVRVKGKNRQIENIDTLFYQKQEKRRAIPMQEWPVASGVYRFTLGEPLKPGEYAIAESTVKEGMSLMVWDFGVNSPDSPRSKKPN